MKIIQFTHEYTIKERLPYQFYGIKTTLPIEKINLMCMYIQLVRAKLPLELFISDDVSEFDGLDLIEIFYKDQYQFETIRSNENISFDYEIDLFDNWNDMLATPLSNINSVAIPNATIKTFEFFKTFLNTETGRDPFFKDQLERVEKTLKGEKVLEEWNWTNMFGEGVFGIYCSPSDEPEFFTR